MAFSHGLRFGSRQLMILTPSALSLRRRLCLPSHRLTSLETCQEALSQMSSRTFLPIFAHLFELCQAPLEKLSRYGRNRSSVYEAQPHLADLGQVEPVAAYGLRLGIVFCDRPLDEAQRVALLAPGVERGKRQAAPPAFVLEAHCPGARVLGGHFHQSVAPPFFVRTGGPGRLSTAWRASSEPPAGAKASPGSSLRRRALR